VFDAVANTEWFDLEKIKVGRLGRFLSWFLKALGMGFSAFQTLRSYLPHGSAQQLYKRVRPTRAAEFEGWLTTPPSDTVHVSFVPLKETKSVFVHVPKVAGTSVGHLLYGSRTGDHMTLLDYRTALPKAVFDGAYKFTFVRNPWDRLVSAYYYLQDDKRSVFDRQQAAGSILNYSSFEAFVMEFMPRGDLNAFIHLKEQHLFLRLPGRGIGVDFVGRFERLNEDFDLIAKRLGKDVALEHRNASALRKSDYREIYTPQMIDVVAKAYARDISYFGYDFEGASTGSA